MKKLKLMLVLTLVLTFMASTVTGFAAADTSKRGGTFIEATFTDPIDFNPALASDNASSNINSFMFIGLLDRDKNMKIIPKLATALPTVSADKKTMTFKLRKDVKWHDGVPVTADDVKFTLEFILDPKTASPRRTNFEAISKIETPDKHTVVLTLSKPDVSLISAFANPYTIPKHIWEKVDRTKAKQSEYNKTKPIGNGPFKFVEHRAAERVVIQANPDYYDGRPNFDKMIFKITPNAATSMVAVESGEAHMVAAPESDIARLKAKSNLNVFVYDRVVFDGIVYNHKTPFFSDKRVRQAFTHTLNKQALINGIYKGIGSPASSSWHPAFDFYEKNTKQYEYSLDKAKKLLDASGWKVGKDGIREKNGKKFKIVMLTNRGNIMREKLLVAVQRQLKLVGVAVEPRILEWNTFLNKYVDAGKFDAYVGGFSTTLDGDHRAFYNSDRKKAYFNKGSYVNKELDKLMEDAQVEFDNTKRNAILSKVQKIVAEDQPMTYIVYRKNSFVIDKKVKDAKIYSILGHMWDVNSWYMAK